MMGPQMSHDPFYASNGVAAPAAVQMAALPHQQHPFGFMPHQQPQTMMMGPPAAMNPFGVQTHPYGAGVPVQGYNPYSGLI